MTTDDINDIEREEIIVEDCKNIKKKHFWEKPKFVFFLLSGLYLFYLDFSNSFSGIVTTVLTVLGIVSICLSIYNFLEGEK